MANAKANGMGFVPPPDDGSFAIVMALPVSLLAGAISALYH